MKETINPISYYFDKKRIRKNRKIEKSKDWLLNNPDKSQKFFNLLYKNSAEVSFENGEVFVYERGRKRKL